MVLDTKWKNIESSNPSAADLRQMYVYHDYFDADKVALVYPGEAQEVSGCYYDSYQLNKVDRDNLSTKECSIIKIPPSESINNWQEAIRHQVIDKWSNFK